MTKLLKNKFLATILAVFTLFAGVITVSKPIKVNAAAPDPLTDDHMEFFARESLADLNLDVDGGSHICFLIDSKLFTEHEDNYTINSTTDLNDLNDTMFFQTMAEVIGGLIGLSQLELPYVNGKIDAGEVFSDVNMDIFINIYNTTQYINVITGENEVFVNVEDLIDNSNTTEDSYIIGLDYKVDNTVEERKLYNFFKKIYDEYTLSCEFHTFEIVSNLQNLPITEHEYT